MLALVMGCTHGGAINIYLFWVKEISLSKSLWCRQGSGVDLFALVPKSEARVYPHIIIVGNYPFLIIFGNYPHVVVV